MSKHTVTEFKIEPIDMNTPEWEELEGFLDKPDHQSVPYHLEAMELPCVFMSCFSKDKQKVVDRLRIELFLLSLEPTVNVYAFLSRPCTINLTPDLVTGGPRYDAFCFLFGTVTNKDGSVSPLNKETLKALGVTITCNEGEVGESLDKAKGNP